MNKLLKTTVYLMIVTIISKCLGFGREIVLGYIYGASIYSDIYIISMNIPIILFDVIGIAIATTFIPLYYEKFNKYGEDESLKFSNNIFNIVLIVGIILSIIFFLLAEHLVKMFAMGFEGRDFHLAVKFTRIMIFGGISIGIRNIMTSFLQIKDNFIIPGMIGLPFNIIIIFSIILSEKYTIYLLPIGTLIAVISQFLFQYLFAKKYGYKYRIILNIKDEYVKKMIWLVSPVFIGVAVNHVNTMVDRSLASTLVEGSISALNYANKLNLFVMGLFITTIGSVIYPMLSKLSSENNKVKFVESVTKSINSIIVFIIPISIGAIVLSKPLVKLLFQRGEFDENATKMTAIALIFYSIGMVGFGLRDILGKIFYSLKDTKTPMINGAMSMILNIILNIILVKFMGHAGLAFATSISAIICIILLFSSLNKKIGYFGQDKVLKTAIKSLISSFIMGIVTHYVYTKLFNLVYTGFIYEVSVLFISIAIGAIVYGVLLIILKVEEVNIIANVIKGKLNRYKDINGADVIK